jgi:hypothetical protein
MTRLTEKDVYPGITVDGLGLGTIFQLTHGPEIVGRVGRHAAPPRSSVSKAFEDVPSKCSKSGNSDCLLLVKMKPAAHMSLGETAVKDSRAGWSVD